MFNHAEFNAEINQAETSRQRGNEGRARVCARRAAGIVARDYLEERGLALKSRSAYDQLRRLAEIESVSQDVRQVLAHFLLKVDESYQLPGEIDLIADARWLAEKLASE